MNEKKYELYLLIWEESVKTGIPADELTVILVAAFVETLRETEE